MWGGVKWKNMMVRASRARIPVSAGRFGRRAAALDGATAGAGAMEGCRVGFTGFKFSWAGRVVRPLVALRTRAKAGNGNGKDNYGDSGCARMTSFMPE